MIDRRRLALRRPRPELLGLSTLDTVTCALAGAIVLMMFMAFLTVPGAQVVLTDMRQVWQAGVGQGEGEDEDQRAAAVEVRNIAVLFIDLETDIGLTADVTQNCNFGEPLHALRSAKGHLTRKDASHALVIWAKRPDPQCTDFKIRIAYDQEFAPPPCEVTLVSGAHFDTRRYSPCRTDFDLYAVKDQVFRLIRLQP